jgi:hypothetical protein
MSDLFKKHQPRMSDEEDRRLWQQVRVPVARSPVRTAGWRSWFALPAVRYGLPALAVVVVAVVWVVERSPVPPAREAAEQAAGRARQADREIALPPSALHTAEAPTEEPAQPQFKLEANVADKSKSSTAPPLAGAKIDAPAAGAVATRELGTAPAKDEDRKERDDRAGASLDEERMSEQKQAVAPTGPEAQSVRPDGASQKTRVAEKRTFAQAPTPAPAASAPAPAQEAAPPPSTAALGKTSAFYRMNDAPVDNGSAGNIVDQVLDPRATARCSGAARGPFADSPARVVAAGGGGRCRSASPRRRSPSAARGRGGTVQVYRVPPMRSCADLAAGAPGEGSALALDGPPVPHRARRPGLQLALVAIEFAQALERATRRRRRASWRCATPRCAWVRAAAPA